MLTRGVVRVGQWVQLHPSILRKDQIAHINFCLKQGLKGNLHPSIENLSALLGILHPPIEIPNDAPVYHEKREFAPPNGV